MLIEFPPCAKHNVHGAYILPNEAENEQLDTEQGKEMEGTGGWTVREALWRRWR